MSDHMITIEVPDAIFSAVEADATRRGETVEGVVRELVSRVYNQDEWETGEITDEERRYHHQQALDREDLWGSDSDKVWDEWRP